MSRFFPKILFLIFILMLPVCSESVAQDLFYSLNGKVIDRSSNEVIPSAIINISSSNLKTGISIVSDLSGQYIVTGLSQGLYRLQVSHVGYESFNGSIMIGTVPEKEFNVYLSPSEIEIERINVTASRTEVSLQQTPSSINIISQEDFRNKNHLTFDDLLYGVQGITIQRSNGINVSSLSIRGSSDVAGGGIGNRVLLLLDGRPSLTGDSKGALWSLVPTAIIERTEIVKGAFSSLYGSSAIGGVINVITKKPTYTPFTSVNLSHGFYQRLNDSLRFTNKLQQFSGADIVHSNTIGKFSYLLNAGYKNNDGHAQQTDYNFYNLNSKLMFDLISNRDIELSIQYTSSSSGFPHYWKKDAGSFAEPFKVADYYIGDRIDKKTFSTDLFYSAIPNSKSKYTTRFYMYNLTSTSTYNGNNPVTNLFGQPGIPFHTYINSYNFGNISQFDIELSRRNYLISGIDMQWNIVRSEPEDILYGDQQMNNFGLFAQDRIDFVSDKDGNSILSNTIGMRADINNIVGGMSSFQVSPKFSLLYSPQIENPVLGNSSFRFLVGRAFRAPSIAEIYFKKELFGGFDFVFNPDLKPEEMLSFELGIRKQYDNRLILDASLFLNSYNHMIQYRNIGTGIYGPFQVQNVAKSEIKGFELMIDYNSSIGFLNDVLRYYFNLSYTYMDAKDLSSDAKDNLLPYKPRNTFNFTTNLTYKGFNWNINGKYQSKIEKAIFYVTEQPDEFFVVNTKLSKQFTRRLSAFVSVNNVFDVFYQELERIPAPNRSFNSGISIEF